MSLSIVHTILNIFRRFLRFLKSFFWIFFLSIFSLNLVFADRWSNSDLSVSYQPQLTIANCSPVNLSFKIWPDQYWCSSYGLDSFKAPSLDVNNNCPDSECLCLYEVTWRSCNSPTIIANWFNSSNPSQVKVLFPTWNGNISSPTWEYFDHTFDRQWKAPLVWSYANYFSDFWLSSLFIENWTLNTSAKTAFYNSVMPSSFVQVFDTDIVIYTFNGSTSVTKRTKRFIDDISYGDMMWWTNLWGKWFYNYLNNITSFDSSLVWEVKCYWSQYWSCSNPSNWEYIWVPLNPSDPWVLQLLFTSTWSTDNPRSWWPSNTSTSFYSMCMNKWDMAQSVVDNLKLCQAQTSLNIFLNRTGADYYSVLLYNINLWKDKNYLQDAELAFSDSAFCKNAVTDLLALYNELWPNSATANSIVYNWFINWIKNSVLNDYKFNSFSVCQDIVTYWSWNLPPGWIAENYSWLVLSWSSLTWFDNQFTLTWVFDWPFAFLNWFFNKVIITDKYLPPISNQFLNYCKASDSSMNIFQWILSLFLVLIWFIFISKFKA